MDRGSCSVAPTAELLVGAVGAVVRPVAELLRGQADGGVVGAHVVRQLAHQRLAVLLVGVVLAVAVAVAHPGLADAARCTARGGTRSTPCLLRTPEEPRLLRLSLVSSHLSPHTCPLTLVSSHSVGG